MIKLYNYKRMYKTYNKNMTERKYLYYTFEKEKRYNKIKVYKKIMQCKHNYNILIDIIARMKIVLVMIIITFLYTFLYVCVHM